MAGRLADLVWSFFHARRHLVENICNTRQQKHIYLVEKLFRLFNVFVVVFQVKSVINLLFAAYTGDVSALRR